LKDNDMQFHEVHPGVTLREELAARGISASALALKLRVPPQRLHEIVRGERSISPDTALRLARFFGTSAEFWMTLQSNHDLAVARRQRGARIETEVEAAA
jgi:addiction module HigA family antidote